MSLTPGQRVIYRGGSCAQMPPLDGVILAKGEHYGHPVWDVRLDNGSVAWGWRYQFDVVPSMAVDDVPDNVVPLRRDYVAPPCDVES